MICIEPIDNRRLATARQIHALLLLAAAQEAALLGGTTSLPAQRSIADIQAGPEYFLGASVDQQLQGWLSLRADDDANQINIASLVVEPAHQRAGIGRSLVIEALRRGNGFVISVATPALNAPALALYAQLGFVEYRRGSIGQPAIELIKLRRASQS